MSDTDRTALIEAALAKLIAGKAPKSSTACQKVLRAYVGKAEESAEGSTADTE